ncbi:uncharacterized protein LOC143299863 [Babylonia areolata]|uniref:uncharacterized protein LOC143299863 n=1 Tax=Babylonia areolata TaxID=304850 RepID=UPI003FD681AD
MDLPSILAELKAAQEDFKLSERGLATAIFCQQVDKALDKVVREADKADFEHLVVGILIVIGSFNDLLPHLVDGPLLTELLDKLFRQCARMVLDIKWQQCDKDGQSQQGFRTSLLTCQQLMAPRGYRRFSVLQTLMDNPWTHPVLSMVMGSEEDNEEGEGLAYIQAQDPEILKLRVELMQQENCDEFALNLCTWCLKHPALSQDFVLRKTQFILLHRLNNIDRLQEECQTMGIEDSVRLINSLLGREEHKELCTMLAQTFLVQHWIKPSDNDTKKELLQLWIRLQYQADQDQDRFIASLWAVAKVSHSTEQLLLIIDAVREQCGDTFLQFCLDLCVFAINVDKGCWEKMKESNTSGPKELQARKRDMAQVCEKISHIVAHVSPKVSYCCALTAFSMVPTEQSLQAVRTAHQRRSQRDVSGKAQCCSNCAADKGQCLNSMGSEKTSREVNVASLYEVERLCGTLRPAYLSSESDFSVLYSMCKQYLLKENGEAVKSALVRRRSAPTIQQVPAVSVPADSLVPNLPVSVGLGLPPGSNLHPATQALVAPVGKTAEAVSHVGHVASALGRDATYKTGVVDTEPGPQGVQKKVPLRSTSVDAVKSGTAVSGQTGGTNPAQQLVLKQLSSDMVQTLLHLIESGQISAAHINHVLTKSPSTSLHALKDIISKAKESSASQKLTASQPTQQHAIQQQQQQQHLQVPVQSQQHFQQQQHHVQQHQHQQQNKLQAQPHHLHKVVNKQYIPSSSSQQHKTHPHSEVPQILQSTNLQPARILTAGQPGLRQQTPHTQQVIAPQPPVQHKVGQPQVLEARVSAPVQSLSSRPYPQEQSKAPVSTQQVLQGVPQLGSVALPALQLTSGGELHVTQPLHVMTFRQPVTVQSSSTATGLQNTQIVMQSSAHMLTHLSGGSVRSAQPHLVHLPSATVTLTGQAPKASPKVHKLIPRAPGPNTVAQDAALSSSVKTMNQVPASSGDIALGNRHYSINNLLFTGEQQNSALSISLPDKLPEISVDSISDTLRALSDSSGVGGQMMPRVSVQMAQNHITKPVTTMQGPTVSLQPAVKKSVPKVTKQQPKSTVKKSTTNIAPVPASVVPPPAPVTVSQGTQSLTATLTSFSLPSANIQACEQTLPSISSLFSSSRSPLPVPRSGIESAATVPLPATTMAPAAGAPPPTKKKGGGQTKGQKKGGSTESAENNKGTKKDKKAVAAHKEEMTRLLKQAMSLQMRNGEQGEGGNVLTGVHPPGQHASPLPQPITSMSASTSRVSPASAWMVDNPPAQGQQPSVSGLRFQPSSQPGLGSSHTAAPTYRPSSATVSQQPAALMPYNTATSTRTTSVLPVAATAPLPSSINNGTRPQVPVTSTDGQQIVAPERSSSKLFNMLKTDKGKGVAELLVTSGVKQVPFSVASYPAPVCREQPGNPMDTVVAGSPTVLNTYGSSADRSTVRNTVSSISQTVAITCSTRHPSALNSASSFAVSGSQKDPAVFHSSGHHTAGTLTSWTPAVSYSAGKAVAPSAVNLPLTTGTVAVTVNAWNPAVARAVDTGAAQLPTVSTSPAIPPIPSVIFDMGSHSTGVPSSNAFQNISITPSVGVLATDPLGIVAGGSTQTLLPQQGMAESADSVSMLVNQAPKDVKASATYRCLICSKAFMTLDALRVHVKRNCKPASDEPEASTSGGISAGASQGAPVDTSSGSEPSAMGGLETTTVFQCMRCFELCISEAGIRAHKQVCSKAPKPKPKAKPKAKPKPKQPKSEEEQATEARVMELLNKCLGENREKLLQETEAEKAKKEAAKKKKRKKSTEDESGEASKHKKPKKSTEQNSHPSNMGPPVPAVLQQKGTPTAEPITKAPVAAGIPASLLPAAPAPQVPPPGDGQAKEEKPKPKRKYYPKKKKTVDVATVTLGSEPLPVPEVGEPGTTPNKPASTKKPASSQPAKPSKPTIEAAPPCPRFKQLSGSGGRSFFKCLNCGQTLCSIENFNDHWSECIQKKPPVPVKAKRVYPKEKKPKVDSSSSPEKRNSATYSSQASIDAIIQSVASGSYASDTPEDEQLVKSAHDSLKTNSNTAGDPCLTEESSYGGGSLEQTPRSLLQAKSSDVVSPWFSEQKGRETTEVIEAYSGLTSIENGGRQNNSVVSNAAGQPASLFQGRVSESSGLSMRWTDAVPTSNIVRDSQTLVPDYVLASQTAQFSAAQGPQTVHADAVRQLVSASGAFQSGTMWSSHTAVSDMSSFSTYASTLSSQATPSNAYSPQTALLQVLASQNTELDPQSIEHSGLTMLSSQAALLDERSLQSSQSHVMSPHTELNGVLPSQTTQIEKRVQGRVDELIAEEPSQTVPLVEDKFQNNLPDASQAGVVSSQGTAVENQSQQRPEEGAAAAQNTKHETRPGSESKQPDALSKTGKPQSKARSKERKKNPSTQKSTKKKSNNAPKVATEDADGESSAGFTVLKPAVKKPTESPNKASPKKPAQQAQDVKEVTYCEMCDRSYSRHWVLLRHFAGQHVQAFIQLTDEGMLYLCPFCLEMFSIKHQFKSHVMIHADILRRLFLDEESLSLEGNKTVSSGKSTEGAAESLATSEADKQLESNVVCESQKSEEPEKENAPETTTVSGRLTDLPTDRLPERDMCEGNPLSTPAVKPPRKKSVRKTTPKQSKSAQSKGEERGKDLSRSPEERKGTKGEKLAVTQTPELVELGKFCRLCQRFFARNWVLMQHIARQHVHLYTLKQDGTKMSYCCDICQKDFPNKASYLVHSSRHTRAIVRHFNTLEAPPTTAGNRDPAVADSCAEEKATATVESEPSNETSVVHEEDTEGQVKNTEEKASNNETEPKGEAFSGEETAPHVETDSSDKVGGESDNKVRVPKNEASSAESSDREAKNDLSEAPPEAERGDIEGSPESSSLSPKRSVKKDLVIPLKKTDCEDALKLLSEDKNKEKITPCDQTVKDDLPLGEGSPAAEVCPPEKTDGGEHAEREPSTVAESEKPATKHATVLSAESEKPASRDTSVSRAESEKPATRDTSIVLRARTKNENTTYDGALNPVKTEKKNNSEDMAGFSTRSGYKGRNTQQLKKNMSQRLKKIISQKREVLKRKGGGVKKPSRRRERVQSGQDHYCRVCCRYFCRKWVLAQHITSQHLHTYTLNQTRSGTSYWCHLCEKPFSPKSVYMYHVTFHSSEIIDHFNSTESLKEVSFGGRTYRITKDASEVASGQKHPSPGNFNRGRNDGHKKRERTGNASRSQSSSFSRRSKLKTVSQSSRKRKRSERVSGSEVRSTASSCSSRDQSFSDPARESSKKKPDSSWSAAKKLKRERPERLAAARVKSEDDQGGKSGAVKTDENKTRSSSATGKKEEKSLTESDSGPPEQRPARTRAEKAKHDSGEDCQRETVPKPDNSGKETKSRQSKAEAPKTDKEKPDKGRRNQKSGRGHEELSKTYIRSLSSAESTSEVKAEHPESEQMDESEKEVGDVCTETVESKLTVSKKERSIPEQKISDKGEKAQTDAKDTAPAKEIVSSVSEASKSTETKNVDRDCIVVCEQLDLKRVMGGPSAAVSSSEKPLSPQTTGLQNPSFLDSFMSFVSTRPTEPPVVHGRSRRRFHSGSSNLLGSCAGKASSPEQTSSEWPVQRPSSFSSAVKTRLALSISEKPPASSPSKNAQDPETPSARTRAKSMELAGLNCKNSEEQLSTVHEVSDPCDSLPSEMSETAGCRRERRNSLKATDVGDEPCSNDNMSGVEGSPDCVTSSSCSRDAVKIPERPEPEPSAGETSQDVDVVKDTEDAPVKDTVPHCSDSSASPEADVLADSEKRKDPHTTVSTASEGEPEEVAMPHTRSVDAADQIPVDSHPSVKLPIDAENLSLVISRNSDGNQNGSSGSADDLPTNTTLTGILNRAIDMAYHDSGLLPRGSNPSLLSSLLMDRAGLDSTSVTCGQLGNRPTGTFSSTTDDGNNKVVVSGHSEETEAHNEFPEPITSLPDSQLSAEERTDPSSGLQFGQSVKETTEGGDPLPVTSADTPPVTEGSNAASSNTSSVPDAENPSITSVLEHPVSSKCVEKTEEKNVGERDSGFPSPVGPGALNSPVTSQGESIYDGSDFSQNSTHPVSPCPAASEPAETAAENQTGSCENTQWSGVSEEAFYYSDDDAEDHDDTSNDAVNLIVLSEDPLPEGPCPESYQSVDQEHASKEQDSVPEYGASTKLSGNGEKRTSELCASSEAEDKGSLDLEGDSKETCSRSAFSDRVLSADATSLSAEKATTQKVLSVDVTNHTVHETQAKEDDSSVPTPQTMKEDACLEEKLQSTVDISHSTATRSSRMFGKRGKFSFDDLDADADLPDLCIEPDVQGKIINTSMKRPENKKPASLSASQSDKMFRFGSGDACCVPEKKAVPYTANKKDSPDVVVSTVVGEYEVTVKQLQSKKSSSESSSKKTYCAKMEVKTEQVPQEGKPAEPPVRKPMLGVKPLRNVHQPEPFVWDMEGEEDGNKRARNERSLRAFQQQVNVAPFSWDMDGGGEAKGRGQGKGSNAAARYKLAQRDQQDVDPLTVKEASSDDASLKQGSSDKGSSDSLMSEKGVPCMKDSDGDLVKHAFINSETANLPKSNNNDSAELDSVNTANSLDGVCQDIHITKNTAVDTAAEDDGSDTPVSNRRNKTKQNKADSTNVDRTEPVPSLAGSCKESGSVDGPTKITRARAGPTQGQLSSRSRTLRSESSDGVVQKRAATSASRERRTEPAMKRPFRKSRSCDNDRSVPGTDGETSVSGTSEHPDTVSSGETQEQNSTNILNISTRSHRNREKSTLDNDTQKPAMGKHMAGLGSRVRNRLRSGLDRQRREKDMDMVQAEENGFCDDHDKVQQEDGHSSPLSPSGSGSKSVRSRDKSSDKNGSQPNAVVKPSDRQDSSKATQPENTGAPMDTGVEGKVLRSRDITPDKAASHLNTLSEQSESESQRTGRTRSRNASSSSHQNQVVSGEERNERVRSKSPSGLEPRPKSSLGKPPVPPPQNLSAMVRRRQHPTSWHKAVSKPAKKRQLLTSPAPQYEIIRVEPVREDSTSDHRRTRSSDRDADTSPRTVHTRVSVGATKPAPHDTSSKKAWSVNRHITPSDIRKRSAADPRFPFSFKRARRKTDTK